MIKAGIAGGIGSGKSGVAKCFEILGVPVYYADDEAKKITNSDKIKKELSKIFGKELFPDGQLDKKKMAKIIFNDEEARKTVNNIIHPAVHDDFVLWSKKQSSELVIIEAAIMFETGFYKSLDQTILVLANKDERIKRLEKRDAIEKNMIKKRMESQEDPENFINLATYLINNNDNDEVLPQVINILNKITNKNG